MAESLSCLAAPDGLCFNAAVQQSLLAFVDDFYEDLELWYPKLCPEKAGCEPCLAGQEVKGHVGKSGYRLRADLLLRDVQSADFCGLLIPGGFMPDKLRRNSQVLALTREFFTQGKLVAFIGRVGWIPISAKILRSQRVTGSLGIKDDLENAGTLWVSAPVVVDDGCILGLALGIGL